jgi:hypothetical protein
MLYRSSKSSWPWSYGSWIYNFLCNQCISPLMLWFESRWGEVYSIQHYVIKFVSDLQQVSGFLKVLPFPPSIKQTAMIILKYCWILRSFFKTNLEYKISDLFGFFQYYVCPNGTLILIIDKQIHYNSIAMIKPAMLKLENDGSLWRMVWDHVNLYGCWVLGRNNWYEGQ